MFRFFLVVVFSGNFFTSFCQDNFERALISLNSELDFVAKLDSYSKSEKPNEIIINQFIRCSEVDLLKGLGDLNFENISGVQSVELITNNWNGNWQIVFQEWRFENDNYATKFVSILNGIKLSHLQDCVNKGGIMWWKNQEKVYFITSRTYYMTFHFKEIKDAVLKGTNN